MELESVQCVEGLIGYPGNHFDVKVMQLVIKSYAIGSMSTMSRIGRGIKYWLFQNCSYHVMADTIHLCRSRSYLSPMTSYRRYPPANRSKFEMGWAWWRVVSQHRESADAETFQRRHSWHRTSSFFGWHDMSSTSSVCGWWRGHLDMPRLQLKVNKY